MRLIFMILGLLVSSCSVFEKRKHEPQDQYPAYPLEIAARADLYCELSQPAYKEKGYVHSRCDGVGFTSLRHVACRDADLGVFSAPDGSLHRDPKHSCFIPPSTPNGSDAGLSKDMVVDRLLAAVETGDLAWLESFVAFAQARDWDVCDAVDPITDVSRCLITQPLAQLLLDARRKLRGETALHAEVDQVDFDPITEQVVVPRGFEAHVQAVRIYTASRVYGAITDGELDALRIQAERQPENGLYQALYHRFSDGNQSIAHELLRNVEHFPEKKLPNNHEHHCTEYLYQRDKDQKDWVPCTGEDFSEHSGTEYGLASYVLEN